MATKNRATKGKVRKIGLTRSSKKAETPPTVEPKQPKQPVPVLVQKQAHWTQSEEIQKAARICKMFMNTPNSRSFHQFNR